MGGREVEGYRGSMQESKGGEVQEEGCELGY